MWCAIVLATIAVLALLLFAAVGGQRARGGPRARGGGPRARGGRPAFSTSLGAWPVGQYGVPSAADATWAANPIAEIDGVDEASCASSCAAGCSGYSYDGGLGRCALWPGAASETTTDGAGTAYEGSLGGFTYGAKRGDAGGSCPGLVGRPCWQSARVPGYSVYTDANIDNAMLSGTTYVATLANCAAACDAVPECSGWSLTGATGGAQSPDGITPGTGSGRCGLHAAEDGCLPLRAAAAKEPSWYAGVKIGTPACAAPS